MADNQAEADQTDETTVADPLDIANTPNNGTTNSLSDYEDEIRAMLENAEDEDAQEPEQSADELDDSDPQDANELDADAFEEEEEADVEEEEEPSAKTQERFRFKSQEDQAIAMIAKTLNKSLIEATDIYRRETGPPQESSQTNERESEQSENLATVESELDALYEQKDAAIRAIDVDEQAELEKKIRQLEKKARVMAVTEAEQSARAAVTQLEKAQQDFDATWDFSRNLYPELNDPNSAMYKEVARLDAEMQELGDPLANDPKRLWDLAKRAGLNTRTPMTKARESSSAPKKGKTGSPVQPASGNRGTTSADPNQKFEQKVEGLQTLDDYEESVRLMLGKA